MISTISRATRRMTEFTPCAQDRYRKGEAYLLPVTVAFIRAAIGKLRAAGAGSEQANEQACDPAANTQP